MVLTGWRRMLSKLFIIPQRYMLGIMGLFALAISFMTRISLSVTITQMVLHKTSSSDQIAGETCPATMRFISGNNSIEKMDFMLQEGAGDRYDWDEATQGLLLSAFYYGYVPSHLPGGLLAEKFGGKWTIFLGMLLNSLATMLTPLAVKLGGAVGLFIFRVIEGLGAGVITPAFILLLSRWIPPTERSRFGAMIFGGAQIGNIFGPFVSGIVLPEGGQWANVFYWFGGSGLIFCIFWTLLCYSTPNTHPYISDEERIYLNGKVQASGLRKKIHPVPIKAMLRSAPLWSLVLATFGHAWGHVTILTDLPKYFYEVLKFNYKETSYVASLPYVTMYVFSIIFAGLCDWFIKKEWHSIETGRKIYTTLSNTMPAIFLIMASYSGCDRVLAVLFIVLSSGFMGAFYCSMKINALDIAPNYAGTCSAIVNGVASAAGMITPYVIGLLTPDQTVAQWRVAFWIVFGAQIGTNILYLIWGSGEQQWWDDVDKLGYPPHWKHGPLDTVPVVDVEKKEVHSKHDHPSV